MPHARFRHILPLLLKQLTFSRVVSIQGARQVGKSFLARELVKSKLPSCEYVTLDKQREREFARTNPESFLESYEGVPLIIDEAQKAPPLFDTIKWKVDENSRPGQFILLGSTEFSREVQVRESLTGRLSRVRLYSMNLAETLQKPIKAANPAMLADRSRFDRRDLMRHLRKGGFPGIFSIHEDARFQEALGSWIALTLERDLLQFPKLKVDPDLAMRVFQQLAVLEEPSNANIASALRCSARTSQKVLDLLQILFAVHKLNPHAAGTGKPLYFYCDVSLASFFGASFKRQLWTWALHEQLSQRSYIGDVKTELTYYRNTKGSVIHLVIEKDTSLCPIKIIETESWDTRDYELLKSFAHKFSSAKKKIALHALASGRQHLKHPTIEVFPWEAAAG